MSPEDRRLLALAAALLPARAAALLGRLRGGEPLGREVARLAAAPRRARLAALATALAGPTAARTGLRAAPLAPHPLLARLAEEARWRATGQPGARPGRPWTAARTAVRPAAGHAPTTPPVPAPLPLARPVE